MPLPLRPLKQRLVRGPDSMIFNPQRLELDEEVTIDVLASSVVSDMMQKSIVGGACAQDKLHHVYKQILNQRTLLPMYPLSDAVDQQTLSQLRYAKRVEKKQ